MADTDGDGVSLDVFPTDSAESTDTDFDGIGNQRDTDDDGDGVSDDSLESELGTQSAQY